MQEVRGPQAALLSSSRSENRSGVGRGRVPRWTRLPRPPPSWSRSSEAGWGLAWSVDLGCYCQLVSSHHRQVNGAPG